MTDSITLRLPWPDAALWQNARTHWRVRHSATRAARSHAAWAATVAGCGRLAIVGRPLLAWTFHRPPKSRADLANVIGAQKAAIDGIQDALMIDDNHFRHVWPQDFAGRVPGGLIVVTITDGGKDG